MDKRTIDVKIGETVYKISSDDLYLDNISVGFDTLMVRLIESLVSEDDVVLDVGANIGCTTILFGTISNKVISFEPSPSTFDFLQQNVRQSGLENISLWNCGLGSEAGNQRLTHAAADRSGAFVSSKTDVGEGYVNETISINRLDDIFDKLGIDRVNFVKIDVEGFECEVIKGAQHIIDRFKPTMVMEMNHWCLNAFQRVTIPDYLDYLLSVFPILYAIDGGVFADLRDASDRYEVTYNHIVNSRFSDLVASFDESGLDRFYATYNRRPR